jgi:hypothetical protein
MQRQTLSIALRAASLGAALCLAPSLASAQTDAAGAVETMSLPSTATPPPASSSSAEIFPGSGRVWMRVQGTDARPIEEARRGAAPWLCSGGQCPVTPGDPSKINAGDGLLQAIKLSTATLPLALTLWRADQGLLFDPSLIGQRSYGHLCAYPPVAESKGKSLDCPDAAPRSAPVDEKGKPLPAPDESDTGELTLVMKWPANAPSAFKYVAIVDTCGHARVQPFQPQFTVPVVLGTTGSCDSKQPKVLKIFPTGGFLQVTAFNLAQPSSGTVVRTTYRVAVPALEQSVGVKTTRMLAPDLAPRHFEVRCRPAAPPPKDPSSDPRKGQGRVTLSHGTAMISPDPLRQGQCTIRITAPWKQRLVAPLALHVSLTRTDKADSNGPVELIRDGAWIVTPTSATFSLPPLSEGFDGESRLRLSVSSDPASPRGSVILLSDAASYRPDEADRDRARRTLGALVIHSVPLCGKGELELLEGKRRCARAYITIPTIIGMIQVTRIPGVERPLVTRNVLSAVGAALAVDGYDPIERKAFPIAGQVGGLFENLGDGKLGVLAYVGVAPTIPVLGSGGNTTSIGLLGGVGLAYVINEKGPDEGVKPAAFLSVLVSVGQASPWSR